ncbi:MAG: hypothetical protein ACFFDH_03065 [Promethearchaeota archaeon]
MLNQKEEKNKINPFSKYYNTNRKRAIDFFNAERNRYGEQEKKDS